MRRLLAGDLDRRSELWLSTEFHERRGPRPPSPPSRRSATLVRGATLTVSDGTHNGSTSFDVQNAAAPGGFTISTTARSDEDSRDRVHRQPRRLRRLRQRQQDLHHWRLLSGLGDSPGCAACAPAIPAANPDVWRDADLRQRHREPVGHRQAGGRHRSTQRRDAHGHRRQRQHLELVRRRAGSPRRLHPVGSVGDREDGGSFFNVTATVYDQFGNLKTNYTRHEHPVGQPRDGARPQRPGAGDDSAPIYTPFLSSRAGPRGPRRRPSSRSSRRPARTITVSDASSAAASTSRSRWIPRRRRILSSAIRISSVQRAAPRHQDEHADLQRVQPPTTRPDALCHVDDVGRFDSVRVLVRDAYREHRRGQHQRDHRHHTGCCRISAATDDTQGIADIRQWPEHQRLGSRTLIGAGGGDRGRRVRQRAHRSGLVNDLKACGNTKCVKMKFGVTNQNFINVIRNAGDGQFDTGGAECHPVGRRARSTTDFSCAGAAYLGSGSEAESRRARDPSRASRRPRWSSSSRRTHQVPGTDVTGTRRASTPASVRRSSVPGTEGAWTTKQDGDRLGGRTTSRVSGSAIADDCGRSWRLDSANPCVALKTKQVVGRPGVSQWPRLHDQRLAVHEGSDLAIVIRKASPWDGKGIILK